MASYWISQVQLGPLPRFIFYYAFLYASFGAASPFFPAFLGERGLSPEQIGVVLAASTAVRLISGPTAGRIADLFHAVKVVLCVCTAAAAIAALCYFPAHSFWLLLIVAVVHSAMLAPLTTTADALTLAAAARSDGRKGFEYGWVRGAGSAAFIIGSLMAGQAVGDEGISVIIGIHALALAVAAAGALILPDDLKPVSDRPTAIEAAGLRVLLRSKVFVRLVLIAALVLGSHAMHDSFAVIRWRAGGIDAALASLLWSEAVAAEVVIFFIYGPSLVNRLGPAGALALACTAGIVRWVIMGLTVNLAAMVIIQPLHGLTFALLHLACMRLIAADVPREFAATAQAIYGTLGVGLATVLLTLLSGWLYAQFGAHGFWAMAAICALALPVIWDLSRIHRAQIGNTLCEERQQAE